MLSCGRLLHLWCVIAATGHRAFSFELRIRGAVERLIIEGLPMMTSLTLTQLIVRVGASRLRLSKGRTVRFLAYCIIVEATETNSPDEALGQFCSKDGGWAVGRLTVFRSTGLINSLRNILQSKDTLNRKMTEPVFVAQLPPELRNLKPLNAILNQ
jgi:hypothetical protein